MVRLPLTNEHLCHLSHECFTLYLRPVLFQVAGCLV